MIEKSKAERLIYDGGCLYRACWRRGDEVERTGRELAAWDRGVHGVTWRISKAVLLAKSQCQKIEANGEGLDF